MESREVKITFEQAKEMFESGNNIFKELALKTFPELGNSQFPKSWEELCELKNNEKGFYLSSCCNIFKSEFEKSSDTRNTVSTEERVEKILLLQQLLEIRDYWNEIDNHKWKVDSNNNFAIRIFDSELQIIGTGYEQYLFCFKTEERAEQFMNTFEKELLQVLSI